MAWTLTVTDLKQYTYCPRIAYFARCLPDVRPVTGKMEEGVAAGQDEESREQRRQLRSYGFTTGDRHFGVALYSAALGLSAQIDLVILRPDRAEVVVPVDYKLSRMVGEHFKLQLASYALLLEEEMDLPAPYGFIYLIPLRRPERVPLPTSTKRKALAALAEIRTIVATEAMPAATARRARCIDCEFRRFCNDVL